jgi:hypothetical protein
MVSGLATEWFRILAENTIHQAEQDVKVVGDKSSWHLHRRCAYILQKVEKKPA